MSEGNSEERGAELEQLLHEASALADDDRWDEALALLREQEERYPEDALLLCMLGSAAQALGQEGHAYDYFRRCLATTPTDPVVLVNAGLGLAAFDDPEAEPALRLAALTSPDLPYARLHYGAYLAHEGMLPEALAELEAARALDAADPEVRLQLGIAYLLAERPADALDELREAVGGEGADSNPRVLLGLALFQAGQMEEAAEALFEVAQEDTEDGELQLLAALACGAQGWEDEAWAALARADTAAVPPPQALVLEVEEAIEDGAAACAEFLGEQLLPPVLRERLLRRG